MNRDLCFSPAALIQAGASPLHIELLMHSLSGSPISMNPSSQEYTAIDPVVNPVSLTEPLGMSGRLGQPLEKIIKFLDDYSLLLCTTVHKF